MTESILQVFDNSDFGSLRVVKDESGEPWFVAKDICKALGVADPHQSLRGFDDDEKGRFNTPTPGGMQKILYVNESGLYRLILKSRKPEAKQFQRWVTHEVLPSIRKDGGYMATVAGETPEQTMARAVLIAKQTIERQTKQIAELTPKARFADAVASSDGTCLIGELAKMLRQNGVNIGQNRLFDRLRKDGYLGKIGQNRNVPTQKAMELGLFRIKETAITHSDGHVTINRTPKVTGKGQTYFMERYAPAEAQVV
jgi:anti-repressor protein